MQIPAQTQILKTNCKGCSFLTSGTCLFNKDLIIEDHNTYVEGYCHIKRDQEWFDKDSSRDPSEILCDIANEESYFSVVISIIDNNLDQLKKILEILKQSPYIQEYIFGINSKLQLTQEVIDIAKTTSKWQIFDIKNEEWTDEQQISHYVLPNSTKNWILIINNNDDIDLDDIEEVAADLIYEQNNYVLYHLPKDKYIINKNVFIQLSGNNDNTIINKIKEFHNCENVCKII